MASADDVFDHHLGVFGAGDIDGILTDYTDQSVIIYGDRIWHGIDGAREFFHMWIDDLLPAGSRFDLIDRVATDDWLYITWTAESEAYRFDFGTDTFLVRDDKILRQTVATYHQRK